MHTTWDLPLLPTFILPLPPAVTCHAYLPNTVRHRQFYHWVSLLCHIPFFTCVYLPRIIRASTARCLPFHRHPHLRVLHLPAFAVNARYRPPCQFAGSACHACCLFWNLRTTWVPTVSASGFTVCHTRTPACLVSFFVVFWFHHGWFVQFCLLLCNYCYPAAFITCTRTPSYCAPLLHANRAAGFRSACVLRCTTLMLPVTWTNMYADFCSLGSGWTFVLCLPRRCRA